MGPRSFANCDSLGCRTLANQRNWKTLKITENRQEQRLRSGDRELRNLRATEAASPAPPRDKQKQSIPPRVTLIHNMIKPALRLRIVLASTALILLAGSFSLRYWSPAEKASS